MLCKKETASRSMGGGSIFKRINSFHILFNGPFSGWLSAVFYVYVAVSIYDVFNFYGHYL